MLSLTYFFLIFSRNRANPVVTIEANCATQGGALSSYCQGVPTSWKPEVCDEGYEQVAYDKCCVIGDSSSCVYAS